MEGPFNPLPADRMRAWTYLLLGERADTCWEAEARLRLAFIEATSSGHGASTGVINVSDQRYQNAVDGMENGMEDLET